MTEHVDTLIVGGGQAGLAASYCLKERGVKHLVLEQARVAESWRSQRWDSFCLVTPNWQCALPGFDYTHDFKGQDPDGFMVRDDIVRYVEMYRDALQPPLLEGVTVHTVRRQNDRFRVETSTKTWEASNLIAATGGYHVPKIPSMSRSLPARVQQLHSSTYKNPDQVGDAAVLVVGTGQSGCQIAEDLLIAGKRVHLSVGSAPRSPRWYRGRDVTAWLVDMGYYAVTVDEHPMGKGVRNKVNHYLSGRGGGREIDLRVLATQGLMLHGRLGSIDGNLMHFGDDLAHNLDAADTAAERIKQKIDTYIDQQQIDAPAAEPFSKAWTVTSANHPLDLEDAQIGTIVWATGFGLRYNWIELDAFDSAGYPEIDRGVCTKVPGLYFLGLPWMWTWGSGRFSGVGADAAHIANRIAAQDHRPKP